MLVYFWCYYSEKSINSGASRLKSKSYDFPHVYRILRHRISNILHIHVKRTIYQKRTHEYSTLQPASDRKCSKPASRAYQLRRAYCASGRHIMYDRTSLPPPSADQETRGAIGVGTIARSSSRKRISTASDSLLPRVSKRHDGLPQPSFPSVSTTTVCAARAVR